MKMLDSGNPDRGAIHSRPSGRTGYKGSLERFSSRYGNDDPRIRLDNAPGRHPDATDVTPRGKTEVDRLK